METPNIKLLPCPFCGHEAEFERVGTHRVSCIVACTWCGARLESNEEGVRCGKDWNTRVPLTKPGDTRPPCPTCGDPADIQNGNLPATCIKHALPASTAITAAQVSR